MKVIITSNIPVLPITLGVELEKSGFTVQHALPDKDKEKKTIDSPLALYGSGVRQEDLKRLERLLSPLTVVPLSDPNLAKDEIHLSLFLPEKLDRWELTIKTDTDKLLTQLKETCIDSFGLKEDKTELAVVERNELVYGSAPKEVRQLLRWFLKIKEINVVENKKFSDTDDDIYLHIRDPEADRLPARERFRVHIATDDHDLAKEFGHKLVEQGFRLGEIGALDKDDLEKAPIGFGADWFDKGLFPSEVQELRSLLTTFSVEKGVDQKRYPVTVSDDLSAGLDAVVSLPIHACLNKSHIPYSGPFPERFKISIYTEQGEKHVPLVNAFKERGFERIAFNKMDEDDLVKGFRVVCKKEHVDPEIFGQVREQVVACMKADEIPESYELETEFGEISLSIMFCDEDEVRIYYPIAAALNDSLAEKISHPKHWECMLQCECPEEWEMEHKELESWGFKSLTIHDSSEDKPKLKYGGAPRALLERLQKHFEESYGLHLALEKSWSKSDDDIFVCLPKLVATQSQAETVPDPDAWFELSLPPRLVGLPRNFLKRTGNTLRIGDLELPAFSGRHHPLAPDLTKFAHFCLDRKTAETLHHLALSLLLKEPCLLEGETSTSKTSSILYLAALQNAPLLRMNLNGQTDSSEMIGRFIPLVGETGATGWQWQDGLLPQAMKQGYRLLYDEYNLGAPEIRERDNSAREYPPSLTLSEYDNSVIGSAECPVHPDFALFATMNPAEYAGRQPMSPADRDRWRAYRFVSAPGEEGYAQMLVFLATGQQPSFELAGISYRENKVAAPIPQLAQVPEIKKIARVVATMHAALERAACSEGGLGAVRKDAFIVTRRGLLSLMLYLAHCFVQEKTPLVERSLRQALYRYYLARATSDEERASVLGIFDAAGLGTHSWSL